MPIAQTKIVFILVGAPGAGKHTLVERGFNGNVKYGYIEMGQIMRDEVAAGSHFGLEIKAYQEDGRMVPDFTTMQIAEREHEKYHDDDVLFSDGFPRTIPQVVPAIGLAKRHGYNKFVVGLVNTSDETCIQRIIAARRGRGDDGSYEKAVARLDVFKTETLPIIGHLKEHLNDYEADFITISGENMEADARGYAEGLCKLYNIPIIKPF